MGKVKDFFLKLKPSRRRVIQLYAALLTNANIKGYVTGNIYKGPTKSVCVPGLNCYSCPGAIGACPIGSLQNALSESSTKTVTYVLGIILLYAIILGRTICGYLCPAGLFQDLMYKIKTPKLKKNKVTYVLSYLKYFILAIFVIGIPLYFGLAANQLPLPSFCKYICPAGTLGGGVLLLSNSNNASYFEMLGGLFTWKFALAVALVVASIFIYRVFCRFLCPLGAIYGLFNKISVLGIHVNKEKCTHCNACVSMCKMDVKEVGDHECINCGECKDVCATHAISYHTEDIVSYFHRIKAQDIKIVSEGSAAMTSPAVAETVAEEPVNTAAPAEKPAEAKKPKHNKKRIITDCVVFGTLTAVTVGCLVYYNFFDKYTVKAPVEGSEVGDICPVQEISLLHGEEGHWSVKDGLGKVTVINFWGLWCTPCCEELPEFNEVYEAHSENLEMIAIHQGARMYDSDTVNEGIVDKGFDAFTIHFGLDDYYDQYFYKLGGDDVWPITIIVDKEGIISYKHDGKLDKDVLTNEVETLIAK